MTTGPLNSVLYIKYNTQGEKIQNAVDDNFNNVVCNTDREVSLKGKRSFDYHTIKTTDCLVADDVVQKSSFSDCHLPCRQKNNLETDG